MQSFNASLSPPWGSPATNSPSENVCQLFPKTGGGDLTHGTAPLQGFWQDAAHHPAALPLPMSPFARPPAPQDRVGGGPSPEQLLAKSLPGEYGGKKLGWGTGPPALCRESQVGPRNVAAGRPQVTSNPGHTREQAFRQPGSFPTPPH